MGPTIRTSDRLRTARPRCWAPIALLATFALAGSAEAAQRYASPTGTGTACTEGTPCSLDTAVEDPSVNNGDEIIVTPGTYTVGAIIIDDAIDMHGPSTGPRPTLNTSDVTGVNVFDAATVHDLNVASSSFFAIAGNADGALLERITASTTVGGAITCFASASVTFRDSLCTATGTNTAGMGTSFSSGTSETIRLRNITAIGDYYGVSFSISGAVTYDIDAKNVIANGLNFGDVRAASSSGATVQITMANSNYATENEVTGGGGVAASVTDPGTGVGNQTAAPVFVGPADYHQDPTSPTVDAGQVDSFLGTGDFEGDARVLEGNGSCPTTPDIGADELFLPAIDCDPPETSIAGGPTGTTDDPTPTFGLVSDEANSTFECRVDSAAFAPCGTPFTTAALSDATHTFEARATDESGNLDPSPASRTFTVDTTTDQPPADTDPPETTITAAPKAKVKTKKKRVRVSYGFAADEPGTFECSLDDEPFSSCSSPLSQRVGKGAHSFSVRAIDAAGNVDGSSATDTFKVKRKRKRRR